MTSKVQVPSATRDGDTLMTLGNLDCAAETVEGTEAGTDVDAVLAVVEEHPSTKRALVAMSKIAGSRFMKQWCQP